ncbi:hypothetical protein Tco_0421108, partial [Tanacetum coccineum]
EMVSDAFNNLYDGNQVPGAFVNHYNQFLGAKGRRFHYNQFLGAKGVTIPLDDHNLFTRALYDGNQFLGVKSVIFSMGDDRAPGPDGFTVAFLKKV